MRPGTSLAFFRFFFATFAAKLLTSPEVTPKAAAAWVAAADAHRENRPSCEESAQAIGFWAGFWLRTRPRGGPCS